MPNATQSSFIPKNNLPNRQKIGRRYNFFFITLIVYALFVGAPIASAVVFIYEKHTVNIINQTTRELNDALKSFSEAKLLEVDHFDKRLIASTAVMNDVVHVDKLIAYFLSKTPQTVAFNNLKVEAEKARLVKVTAQVVSDSFDYVLFYRDELVKNVAFSNSVITNLTYNSEATEEKKDQSRSTTKVLDNTGKLTYNVEVTLPVSFISSLPAEETPLVTNRDNR